jgi:hypothetical protein
VDSIQSASLGLTPNSWKEFIIDGRDPSLVTRLLLEYCAPIVSGPLVIATFQSFRPQVEPFYIHTDQLQEFVSEYLDIYDDVPVVGDVIVVAPKAGVVVVVVVHHNGLIATLRGSKCCE